MPPSFLLPQYDTTWGRRVHSYYVPGPRKRYKRVPLGRRVQVGDRFQDGSVWRHRDRPWSPFVRQFWDDLPFYRRVR
jgi:hypothetical protein